MDLLVPAALAAAVAAVALLLLLKGRGDHGAAQGEKSGRPATAPAGGKSEPIPGLCPLCGTVLGRGERVKSDISPGAGDRIMRIFGCPRCWPPTPATIRACPVCGGEIPREGWAIARYFEKPGRRHVHVLGCTACRKNSRR